MTITLPPDLVDLQRSAHAAWAEVEAHRKRVDADRRAAPRVETDRGPMLRPWTSDEAAKQERLMGVVLAAQEARHRALAGSGLGAGYETVQALHAAARAGG